MQGRSVDRVQRMLRRVNMGGRNNPLELRVGCAFVPLANRGERGERILLTRIDVEPGVEDKLGADQAAGIVARRIVVVGTQVIGGTIAELACGIDVEQTDLCAPALVAVTDDGNRVLGY